MSKWYKPPIFKTIWGEDKHYTTDDYAPYDDDYLAMQIAPPVLEEKIRQLEHEITTIFIESQGKYGRDCGDD